jgi:hypothetical protein
VPLVNVNVFEIIEVAESPEWTRGANVLSALSPFKAMLFSFFRSRAALQVEILALRHQIGVLRRSAKKRPTLTVADRLFWAWLCGIWAGWRSALVIVKPETVIACTAEDFACFGPGRFGTDKPEGLQSRRKSGI